LTINLHKPLEFDFILHYLLPDEQLFFSHQTQHKQLF